MHPSEPAPLSRDALREVDRRAEAELGLPGVVLMENAARGAVDLASRALAPTAGPVVILCGPGNNGGDGYAMARWFTIAGRDVRTVSSRAPALDDRGPIGDAAVMRRVARRMGVPDRTARTADEWRAALDVGGDCALLVDALLGTGFAGEVRAPLDAAIDALHAARESSGAPILAVDVPSGLECDQGTAARSTVRADLTVTFVAPKLGFAAARAFTGDVLTASIGVPPALVDAVRSATDGAAR